MSRSLERFLREHPEGVRPRDVADRVLRLEGPEEWLVRLGEASLEALPEAHRGEDGLWRILEGAPRSVVALAGLATGPHPEWDLLLEIGAAEIRDGGIARTFTSLVRPEGPLTPAARAVVGPIEARLQSGMPLGSVLQTVGAVLEDADAVWFDDDAPARFLLRALGRPLAPPSALRLATVLRRAGLIRRGSGLDAAADALGISTPVSGTAGDRASTVAEVYLAARRRGLPFEVVSEPPPFDFSESAIRPELLAGLPEEPGIYLFYDREDRLLYVGKARDLRRRVAGYFGRKRRRRRLHADLMARVHRLEWETTGSEIAALFEELRRIREDQPPFNVQRAVRLRRPLAGDLALLLPGRAPKEVRIQLVREGVPVTELSSDRRARGMRAVRAALRETYFSGRPPPAAGEKAQLLSTWLRAEGDRVNWVDLGEVSGIDEAARRLRSALTDPELFHRKSFYR